jgi:splicing factor 45
VVLLRNMVGPGEVDEALEDEVAEECTKYGQVNRVLIFEVTEAGFPPTEAVRIFIQFDKMESAVKVSHRAPSRRPLSCLHFPL